MGNREKLLAGAKQCLVERGYARTTARDVAAASGANLASTGYHFGSMEALLTAAIVEALEEWSDGFDEALVAAPVPDLETTWAGIVGSFEAARPILLASFEAFVQSQHLPEVRARLADAYEEARTGLATMFLGPEAMRDDPVAARAAGSVALAMMTGLMTQWFTDPDRALSAEEIALGLRELATRPSSAAPGPDAP